MRRLLLLLVLPLLGWGQTTREQEVAARLAAGTAPDLAWAAALAARYQLSEFVPRIEELLSHSDPSVRAQALSALIELQVENTPWSTLEPLAETDFDAVMILLARQPTSARPVLLEWSRKRLDDHQWMTVQSLLATTKAPGQAAVLLRDWSYRADVRVLDVPELNLRPQAHACGDYISISRGPYPPAPPHRRIGVAVPPALQKEIASGPHPLWMIGSCFMPVVVDRSLFPLDYLRYLGNTIPAPKLEIQFRSAAQFERDLTQLRREMRDFMQVLHRSLVYAGALAENEWVEPKIEWSLVDRRADRSVPLPPLR